MTLTELKYIVAVARLQHFGKAAEACFVSQPTLSVAVKKLEEQLDIAIFERGKSHVAVTPQGEKIVQQAQRVLEEAAVIEKIAKQGKDQLAEPLRVGAIFTIGPYLLPYLVPVLHELAPDMALVLEENYTAVLSEQLGNGELDVIIISLPFEKPGIVTQVIYEEDFVFLLPKNHPWEKRKSIDAREIDADNVLLLGQGHCFRDQVIEACPNCRPGAFTESSMQKMVEGSSLETIRYMVASGMGTTVLPCSAAASQDASKNLLTVRQFDSPPPKRQVALAWRSSFPRPQAIDILKQALRSSNLSCIQLID